MSYRSEAETLHCGLVSRRSRFTEILLRLILFVLAVFAVIVFTTTLHTVYNYQFPALVGDEWDDVKYYINWLSGSLNFSDLFDQHNEHRVFFPRLIFFLDFYFDHGAGTINLICIQLIQIAYVAILFWVFTKSQPGLTEKLTALSFAVIMMFSLGQLENFQWGFQVQFVGVGLAASLAFMSFAAAVNRAERHLRWWHLGVATLAMLTVAAFSMANGVLAGVVLIFLSVAIRAPFALTIQVAVGTGLLAFAYFLNFHPITIHTPYSYVSDHPLQYFLYNLSYLGNITRHDIDVYNDIYLALLLGGIGLIGTVAALLREFSRRDHNSARVILLAIILFVVGTGMVTALGRVGFGLEQATAQRYRSPVAVFWTALVFYWHSVLSEKSPRIARIFLTGAACVIVIGPLVAHFNGRLQARRYAPLYDRAAMALLSDVDDHQSLSLLYLDVARLRDVAQVVRAHHLSLFASSEADAFGRRIDAVYARMSSGCIGNIDSMTGEPLIPPPGLSAYGWAWDTGAKRPVDRIFFTTLSGQIIGIARGGHVRNDVSAARGTTAEVGWEGYLKAESDQTVLAYAVLSPTTICPIGRAIAPFRRQVALVGLAELGPVIPAPSASGGNWTLNGQNPIAGKPAVSDPVMGSWSGADKNGGDLIFGPFTAPSDDVVLPIVTGPDTAGLEIVVSDARTGTTLSTSHVPKTTTWQAIEIPLGSRPAGQSLKIKLTDHGSSWGEWFAVGLLHAPADGPR